MSCRTASKGSRALTPRSWRFCVCCCLTFNPTSKFWRSHQELKSSSCTLKSRIEGAIEMYIRSRPIAEQALFWNRFRERVDNVAVSNQIKRCMKHGQIMELYEYLLGQRHFLCRFPNVASKLRTLFHNASAAWDETRISEMNQFFDRLSPPRETKLHLELSVITLPETRIDYLFKRMDDNGDCVCCILDEHSGSLFWENLNLPAGMAQEIRVVVQLVVDRFLDSLSLGEREQFQQRIEQWSPPSAPTHK